MNAVFSVVFFGLGTLLVAGVLFVAMLAFTQTRKDVHADEVSRALQARLAAHRPPLGAGQPLPPHAGGLSYWANHQPPAAPLVDRWWNSAYPAVAGTVANQRELEQVREIVRAVCAERGYNPELVAFFVEVDAQK
jgi:hypothetical protein